MKVMEDKGEIHLTAEEHAAFVQCLRLLRKLDDMERLQLYFRGHTLPRTYECGGLPQKNQSNLILTARNNPGRFSHLVNHKNVTNGKDVTSVASLFV